LPEAIVRPQMETWLMRRNSERPPRLFKPYPCYGGFRRNNLGGHGEAFTMGPMSTKRFKVDARAVISLGRDSIKDHVTALVELVKNSYDAGATVTEIELSLDHPDSKKHFIRIADNGSGMNESDVERKWLRIGYSDKLKQKKVGGRRLLGEKGVGRLSADRLGECMQLRAQSKHEAPIGIQVDWADFESAGTDIDRRVHPPRGPLAIGSEHPSAQPGQAASSGELDRLAGVVEEAMQAARYSPAAMREANRRDLRLLLLRLRLGSRDARRILGLFRRMLWRLEK